MRFRSHLDWKSWKGGQWTSAHKPITVVAFIPVYDGNVYQFEDMTTKDMMRIHGIDLVRGGSYSFPRIDGPVKERLEVELRSAKETCFRCNSADHNMATCDLWTRPSASDIARAARSTSSAAVSSATDTGGTRTPTGSDIAGAGQSSGSAVVGPAVGASAPSAVRFPRAATSAVGSAGCAARLAMPRPSNTTPVSLVPSVWIANGQAGDFEWEIQQEILAGARPPKGQRTLWVYNDNVSHRHTNIRGSGNAAARQFNRFSVAYQSEPFSTGVTTGSLHSGGFRGLDASTRKIIDDDLAELKKLVCTGDYSCIKYSSDGSRHNGLGTGTFSDKRAVAATVKNYILVGLRDAAHKLDDLLQQQHANRRGCQRRSFFIFLGVPFGPGLGPSAFAVGMLRDIFKKQRARLASPAALAVRLDDSAAVAVAAVQGG